MSLVDIRDPRVLSRVSINYFFFGFYYIFITILHVYHVYLVESVASFTRYFFMVYAVVECSIETILLILLANGVRHFFSFLGKTIFSTLVVLLLFTHFIDLPLVRFMDMSFWYGINFIFQESWQNFVELLYASNVSLWVWFFCFLGGFLILGLIVSLYLVTERWIATRPLVFSYSPIAALLCGLCLFLGTWDYSVQKFARTNEFSRYAKTLPWKNTLRKQKQSFLPLLHPLKPFKAFDAKEIAKAHVVKRKPDIYLFVIESLREDFITPDLAPHLSTFKTQCVTFDLALANANATHSSWFSLFYSCYPFYWDEVKDKNYKAGSPSLQLLKEIGYKINVCTSSRLTYYQMDRILFGAAGHLADNLFAFEDALHDESYQRDEQAVDRLISEMQTGEAGGHLYIIFLDATHLGYSFPHDTHGIFKPFEDKINYIKAAFTNKGIEKIQNRYRNAIFFIDSLFGRFFHALKKKPGGDDSVVIVTGDHGEEFFEQGHLFHASSLSHPQMHVPLYYKFGNGPIPFPHREQGMSCHMDIFPSLFHYIFDQEIATTFQQGESIFRERRWPFTVTARFNASRPPYEFCIHSVKEKIIASFSDERSITRSRGLRIISSRGIQDNVLPYDIHKIKSQYAPAIDHIFAP